MVLRWTGPSWMAKIDGLVRVHVRKGTGQIIGATVVAADVGDLIGEVTLAMNGKLVSRPLPGRFIRIRPRPSPSARSVNSTTAPA